MSVSTSGTILERLSNFTASLRFEDIPNDVKNRANRCFFDFVGCMLGALSVPENQSLIRQITALNPSQEVTAWGMDGKCGIAEAALAGGYLGYELEYDDGVPTAGHWGSASIPAAYFANELYGGDGEGLITSIVVAYETATRISRFFSPRLLSRHVHFPCTMGAFAAITGYCKAAGFSAELTADALSLVGLFPQGTYSTALSGGKGKSLYSGWPNLLGVYAARFAEMGLTGDRDVLENPDGFTAALGLPSVSPEDADEICGGLGQRYRILDGYFKPYPCCRWLHAPVAAACTAAQRVGFSASEIRAVDILAPKFAVMYNTHSGYESKVACQYSFPYSVAAALCLGKLELSAYDEQRRCDPEILELSKKINVIPDTSLDKLFPETYRIRLEIFFTDGSRFSISQEQLWGAENPPTDDELIEKFCLLTKTFLSAEDTRAWIDCYKRGFYTPEAYKQAVSLLSKKLF